jgi:hypothetical protein
MRTISDGCSVVVPATPAVVHAVFPRDPRRK